MEFSIEKAQALLDYIKTVSEEDSALLEKVNIDFDENIHPMFGYQPISKTIYITIEPLEGSQDVKIIDYMNKEFDLNLKNTPLTRFIHAFLHELGHHMDIGDANREELEQYMGKYLGYDAEIKARTFANNHRLINTLDDMKYYIELSEEEDITPGLFLNRMDELVETYNELRLERIEIDNDYRRNPAEYAADAFAAKILDKYLRKTMPELFEPQEHVIRKLDK